MICVTGVKIVVINHTIMCLHVVYNYVLTDHTFTKVNLRGIPAAKTQQLKINQ